MWRRFIDVSEGLLTNESSVGEGSFFFGPGDVVVVSLALLIDLCK